MHGLGVNQTFSRQPEQEQEQQQQQQQQQQQLLPFVDLSAIAAGKNDLLLKITILA